jgi:hypothetical protein
LLLAAALWGGRDALAAIEDQPFHFPSSADSAPSETAPDAAAPEPVDEVCRRRLRRRRILFLVGELHGDQWLTAQDRFLPLLQVIDQRLRALGFGMYTPQQIKAGIAQAEIDAYFKNDPDAALSASKRLGADYVLRGAITSQTGVNPVVQVNEVAVNIDITLSRVDGRPLSDVTARAESYSGSDTLHTAVELVNEQADRLVSQLAQDYCHQPAPSR